MRIRSFARALVLAAAYFTAALGWAADASDSTDPADSADTATKEPKLSLQPDRTLSLSLQEGTWISLDVAADDGSIIFELLGDLYRLPMTGGKATAITSGMAFDSQPSVSPDGETLAFISDRSGNDDVWLLDLTDESAEPKKLTKLSNTSDLASPTWTPDGSQIVVSKSTWTQRTFELWSYAVEGGSGVQLTKAMATKDTPSAQRHNALGAAFSPDGRYLYYARKNGGFGYNVRFPLWQIARKDLQTGAEDIITQAAGSAIRPVVSPDGQWLVYGTRHKQKTGLRLRNLQSGDDQWLAYPISRDEQESRFTRDLLPGYAFTSDSRSVIATRRGGIVRIDVASRNVEEIPFDAQAEIEVADRLDFKYRTGLQPVKARVLAEPRLSPDGNRVAFATLTRIYVHDYESGETEVISPASISAGMPSWSPDGRHLVYAGWNDGQGAVFKQRARPGARVRKLTEDNGYYSYPTYTPDGERIVVLRGSAHDARQRAGGWGQTPGADVVWLAADGGPLNLILPSRGFSRPHFGPEADRVYLYISTTPLPSRGKTGLISVRYDGSDRRDHLTVQGRGIYFAQDHGNPTAMYIAPNGKHVLFQHANQLYVTAPVPFLPKQSLKIDSPNIPLKKLTDVGADFISWSADGSEIIWAAGNIIYRRPMSSVKFTDDKKEEAQGETEEAAAEEDKSVLLEDADEVTATEIAIYLPRDKPTGVVALTGAKIITMGPKGTIEDGTVVVEDDRISAVGTRDEVSIPEGAEVIDVAGQYITPGFVDTHAHFRISKQLFNLSEFSMLANLAYGVTTGIDVQPTTVDILDVQDRIDAGQMLGPRAFSTGPGVFSDNDFSSYEHALAIMRRYKERYKVNNIKAYISGSRQQRHWLVRAAKELKIMPTTEGALDMKMNVTHAIDGFSGLEHAYPVPVLREDIIQLTAQTRMAYTPTLLVLYGGPWAEEWFFTQENPYQDEKLRRFMPYRQLAGRTLRRQWFHPSEYMTDVTASSARKVVEAGGQVGVGAHGQLQGLGYHWELWSLASGDFSNHEALRAATLMGAEMIGLSDDLGSIEVGKLADMVILRRDPLEDIRNTNTLSHVMLNGRIYDADTLDQTWPEQKPLPEQWWWQDEAEELAEQQ